MIDSMSLVILWSADSMPCLPHPSLMTVAQSRSRMDAMLGVPMESPTLYRRQVNPFNSKYATDYSLYEYILQFPNSSALESVGPTHNLSALLTLCQFLTGSMHDFQSVTLCASHSPGGSVH